MTRFILHIACSLVVFAGLLCLGITAEAAGVRIVGPSTPVPAGQDFYLDIIAEGIPPEGLGAMQFRINANAIGGNAIGVSDLSQACDDAVCIASPLLESPATETRSGIGDFFWSARGSNGILFIDNQQLVNGSALFTYAHTSGAVPPSGSGIVARFRGHVGAGTKAQRLDFMLTQVMLINGGVSYPLDYNFGAAVQIPCIAKAPALFGLTRAEATAVLSGANLQLGNVYEIENVGGNYPLNVVLEQSYPTGTEIACMTPVNLAINTPPAVSIDQATYLANISRQTITGTMEQGALVNVASNSPVSAGVVSYPTPTTWSCVVHGLLEGDNAINVSAVDAFGNRSTKSGLITYSNTGSAVLDVAISGTGSGTVSSTPSSIVCNTNCWAPFTKGQTVTLRAAPSQYSIFAGWFNGACSGTGDCAIPINSDVSVTAVFNRFIDHQVRLDGTQNYYATLQDAYNSAATGSVLKLWAVDFHEDLICDRPVKVTFRGGFDENYSMVSGQTVIDGALSIAAGTVIVDNLTIR